MTAARVPLPHWRTQSRPYRHPRPAPAVHGPAYFAAFARSANKRLIAVGKFDRLMKDHLSMSQKLRFRILRCNRNDTFSRAFVNFLPFSGLARRLSVKDRTPSRPVSVADMWSPPRGRPHRLTAGRGAAPCPARTVSGNVSDCRGSVSGKNSKLFTHARKNK